MSEISELRIEAKQADEDILELIILMELDNQTNQQKYEVIKPFSERLNLYCDEISLRFEKDTDLFAIPLSSISCAEYEEDNDALFILFKNKHLHELNLSDKTHNIYIIKEQHNCIVEFLLNIYNRIRIAFIVFKLKWKTIRYIKKLISNNQKQNS
ncbi:hypothetical protein [Bacteroides fragilis]|uniref:Uncharacterized protein n=1 Tax=Bacteroides fragilis TaxID=817 RepID=A0AAP8ZY27_BACFG|nr:hypothetical protein [Bacteroides fragilis]MBV4152354.1 hypothetical protein [Bacteroides fragilis]MCE8578982.1 hypothetical protein [Bacteroides fragilis]MCE8649735.1 hypothetical protein [Bacteroides fragilis]MCM0368809.1 hypothetical protein [Bacteroides fragilis]MCS2597578.1 hypothetical protein [Bacteroides fragilis]